ncbi:MAG: SPASM domain-containing protein [Acidobacteria bacterium]|nr:SPASM domain-containing protein [Acidobacteriota bacterium]
MPVTYQGLVVENTSACNAKCRMCYQAAGPTGSDILGKASLSPEQVEILLADALHIPSLARRFHLAGGEAFLRPADCFRLFRTARSLGYEDITTTTNAYWAYTPNRAAAICQEARDAGLRRMEISWDFWHLDHIRADCVSNALEAGARFGISTVLRILTTQSHSIAEALSHLRPDALELATEIQSCPVFPTGRAASEIPPDDIFYGQDLGGNCHAILHLTVNARGNVYPCCAGADQTQGLSFGNIHQESIRDIAVRMNSSRLLRTLVFFGVGALEPILREHGVQLGDRFSNICHLCWEIFSRPERAAIVHQFFREQELHEAQRLEQLLPILQSAQES